MLRFTGFSLDFTGIVTTLLTGGKGLSAGEKWLNLFGEQKWPAGNIEVVDGSVKLEYKCLCVHIFSMVIANTLKGK